MAKLQRAKRSVWNPAEAMPPFQLARHVLVVLEFAQIEGKNY
jgi:hypothetical protein